VLLSRPRTHENLYHLAISTSIPHEKVPNRLLDPTCSSMLLHDLDNRQQYLRLRSCTCFLDQRTRTMYRSIRHVVYQRDNQHPDRFRNHHTANARHQATATWKTTEICAHGYFRCRWVVSTPLFALSHIRQTRVRSTWLDTRFTSRLRVPCNIDRLHRSYRALLYPNILP
jgi:hypothetical protein